MVEIIKQKINKNLLVYPIFYNCLDYINDPFWYDVFENLALGKCPSCIYISKNTIFASNKRKGFLYSIPNDVDNLCYKSLFNELKEIFINNTPLYSNIDMENQKKDKLKEIVIKDDDSWSKIRKKNEKELHIINFVLRSKNKYSLDWTKTRHLYSLIKNGFILKTQSSKDIIFEKNKIKSINGIEYDPNLGYFVNKFKSKPIPKEEEENKRNYLFFFWDRYVSNMVKK